MKRANITLLVVLCLLACLASHSPVSSGSGLTPAAAPFQSAPVAEAGGPYAVTLGLPVVLNGEASTGYTTQTQAATGAPSITWSFGDSTNDCHLIRATHLYEEPGTYTATLTVKNASGVTSTDTATVTVTAIAAPTTTITVSASDNLQDKLAAATAARSSGNVDLVLAAGATFTGNFVVPAHATTNWLTIRSDGWSPATTIARTRVTPADAASMATLKTTNSEPALKTEINTGGSSYVRLVGVHLRTVFSAALSYDTLRVGSTWPDTGNGQQVSASQVPHDWIVERCVIRGNPSSGSIRGIALHAHRAGVFGNYVYDYFVAGFEAQAIGGQNGLGNFSFVNNELVGAGENVIFGGGDALIRYTATPSNVTTTSATLSSVAGLAVGDCISFTVGGSRPIGGATATYVRSISGNNITFDAMASAPDTAANSAQWGNQAGRNVEVRRNYMRKPPEWENAIFFPNPAGLAGAGAAGGSLNPSTAYTYAVAALGNKTEEATRPAYVDGQTLVSAPITVTPGGSNGRVNLTWTAPSSPNFTITGYRVYRTTSGWFLNDYYDTGSTATSFSDTGATRTGAGGTMSGTRFTVKNLFELKSAQYTWVDGNVFEYHWAQAQGGESILFTPHDQDGYTTWSTVSDSQFTNNRISHVSSGYNILDSGFNHPGGVQNNLYLANNLFADVDPLEWGGWDDAGIPGGSGRLVKTSGNPRNVTLRHHTHLSANASGIWGGDGAAVSGAKFVDNVGVKGFFGFLTGNQNEGPGTFDAMLPMGVFGGNWLSLEGSQPGTGTIEGADAAYPDGFNFVLLITDLQFTNFAGGNYSLAAGSPAKNAGTDGTDPGVNVAALNAATAGAESGVWDARTNVALASNGGSATASTEHASGNFPASGVNNGDRRGLNWGAGGGWNDATLNSFNDWVEVSFAGSKTISEIDVFTVQDNFASPSEPTAAMTFSQYGVTQFDVQTWDGAQWVTVPGGAVTGNDKVWRKFVFAPVMTTKIRVLVRDALEGYSRVVEVQAWQRVNHALAANGGVATASSTINANYPASGVNNGDRRGLNWGAGGGWNDATLNSFPDWVEVAFNGAKSISEIDVFTVQDNFASPSEPTGAMTFTLYGITQFDVQAWDGAQWVTVGSVTGNNLVWHRFTFTPVVTTKVRVLVTNALDGYSRITEVEAY